MRTFVNLVLVFLAQSAMAQAAPSQEKVVFEENFNGELAKGWSWIRENPHGWRISSKGLEIRVEPGNMWGGQNNAKNVLVRPAPEPAEQVVTATLLLQNQPTNQYEQVNLVWYYDDGHMVKLGQEMVDGQLSIVMGREERDQTRTIAIIPLDAFLVEVRFTASGERLTGHFRKRGVGEWVRAGDCELPRKPGGKPHISIQCYQGPADSEHWATLKHLRVAVSPRE